MAVAQRAVTRRLKGQRSRSHGYESCHGRTAAIGPVKCAAAAVAWGCTSYDCSGL